MAGTSPAKRLLLAALLGFLSATGAAAWKWHEIARAVTLAWQVRRLESERPLVRAQAIERICRVHAEDPGPDTPAAVGDLVPFLEDPNLAVRATAFNELHRFVSPSLAVRLEPLLRGRIPHTRVCAAALLQECGAMSPRSWELLLRDRSRDVRADTLRMLRQDEADRTAETIRGLLEDPDPTVRGEAIVALGQLGDLTVQPELLRLLGGTEWDRRLALRALRHPAHRALTPQVAACLDDPSDGVQREAILTLERLCGQDFGSATLPVPPCLAAARAWWETHRSDPE